MQKNIQLQVARPCHENWTNMTDSDKGRFCLSCQKEVIDFTTMSDQQILAQISRASAGFCGRFNNEQLNRDIKEDKKPRLNWYKYLVHVTIPALIVTNKISAQDKGVKGDTIVCSPVKDTAQRMIGKVAVNETRSDSAFEIEGIVASSKGEAIPGASIMVKGDKYGTAADMNGKFKLNVKNKADQVTLRVSAIGFENKEIIVNKNNSQQKVIVLSLNESMMGEVVTVGVVVTAVKKRKPVLQQIKDTISNICYKSSVKVYPNPVHFGSNLNIDFDIKEIGEYDILISNISGQPLLHKKIMLTSKNQTESIALTENFSAGIYFITVENSSSKKMYSNKILIN